MKQPHSQSGWWSPASPQWVEVAVAGSSAGEGTAETELLLVSRSQTSPAGLWLRETKVLQGGNLSHGLTLSDSLSAARRAPRVSLRLCFSLALQAGGGTF